MTDHMLQWLQDTSFWPEAQFVAKYGKPYTYQRMPKGFKAGTPKACYSNANGLALRNEGLVYVEGFMTYKNIPMQHAWVVVRGTNVVIDVTATGCENYYGVAFTRERVLFQRKAARTTHNISVISDQRNGSPVLQMTAKQLKRILEP